MERCGKAAPGADRAEPVVEQDEGALVRVAGERDRLDAPAVDADVELDWTAQATPRYRRIAFVHFSL